MEKKNFKALLRKILDLQNLEEELSAVIREVETNIEFQALGIYLKPKNHKKFRLKISRNISFAYQKSGVFAEDSFLLNELAKFETLVFDDPKELKFESDYFELLVLPLHYQDVLYGFFFIQKKTTYFTDEEKYLLETITSLISMLIKLSRQEELIQHLDQTDKVSGLLNHNGFLEKGDNLFKHSQRYAYPLTIIGIGINKFSEVLEEIGHQAMNKEITTIAGILEHGIRNTEVLGYVNDGLFAVLLTQIQPEGIESLIDRIKLNINSNTQLIKTNWGVANYSSKYNSLEDLLHIVEECVFEAGRNDEHNVIWDKQL